MFRSMLAALSCLVTQARSPAPRPRRTSRPLTGPELLEDRVTPAVTTHVELLPLTDTHLTPGNTVTVGRINVDGNRSNAAISSVVIDDVRQGAFDFVGTAALYRLTPNGRVLVDTSPVSHPTLGGLIVFNQFGYINVANTVAFEVDVTGKASATPYNVHAEIAPSGALGVAFAGRNLGAFNYQAHPGVGNTQEENRVPNLGGVQRTLYNIETLDDTTVSATDRQKTVWSGYVQSSDSRAFFRCIRFMTNDSSRLDFINTASVWKEIAPGQWDRLMTVRPNAHGQLIFTIYQVGRTVATGGAGAHIRVTVDANPTMVGVRNVDVGFYFSTFPYAGRWSFAAYQPNAPIPPVTHGPLSVNSLFYAAQPGVGVRVADFNIGTGPNASFTRLDLTVGTGSFFSASNVKLYRTDANGNAYGPALGSVTFNNGGQLVIDGINTIIDAPSNRFSLFADLTNPLQLFGASAIG